MGETPASSTAEQQGLIGPLATEKGGANIVKTIQNAQHRASDPKATQELRSAPLISGLKGWGAYGAFDPQERSDALDLLGFKKTIGLPDLFHWSIRVFEKTGQTLWRYRYADSAYGRLLPE